MEWSDNPELVRAHLAGDIPDLEAFTYLEELVDPDTGEPMRREVALNLRPGDAIWINENWWIVIQHSINMNNPASVTMNLRSRDDSHFGKVVLTAPTRRYPYDPGLSP